MTKQWRVSNFIILLQMSGGELNQSTVVFLLRYKSTALFIRTLVSFVINPMFAKYALDISGRKRKDLTCKPVP